MLRFPAESVAVTEMTLRPDFSATSVSHEVVPVAAPRPPLSLSQVTDATERSSSAIPERVIDRRAVRQVEAFVGDAIATTGVVDNPRWTMVNGCAAIRSDPVREEAPVLLFATA